MPPTRQHDPFTDAPLRPTTSNAGSLAPASLRSQTSQQSLRSNASTASARTRQQRDLFAPSLSRRPAGRATPHVEDDVLADSDSEGELAAQRQRQQRRVRHGSPKGKSSRHKIKQDEEHDFVNRQPDGSYILSVAGFGETVAVPQMSVPQSQQEFDQAKLDLHYAGIARQYFASGLSLGTKTSKKQEEELETLKIPMMMRLREQVMQKLEDERWQYEPTDGFPRVGL